MRMIFLITRRLLAALLSLVAAYLLIALTLSLWRTRPPSHQCEQMREIFVATNGVHLYLILSVDLIDKELGAQLSFSDETSFVAFGWGDRAFYLETPTWADLRFGTAFRALFLPTGAAMHVTSYTTQVASWRAVRLCPEQIAGLNLFVSSSFRRDEQGRIQPITVPIGYGPEDFFYEGTGTYTCFRTSNVWVNEALKRADVSTAVWSPFDWGVMWML